jgi:hypothetical protein
VDSVSVGDIVLRALMLKAADDAPMAVLQMAEVWADYRAPNW